MLVERMNIENLETELTSPCSSSESSMMVSDTTKVPDSGLRAWTVVFGCMFVSTMTFGMINSYAVFQTHYETVLFSTTPSWKLSIIGASQASGIYLVTPLAIPLHHAFGMRWVLCVGGCMLVIAFLGLSSMDETQGQLWKCYIFQGMFFLVGSGLLFPPVMLTPIEWFDKNKALALGVSQSGVGIGGTMWPLVFKRVVQKYGFKWTMRCFGLMYIPLSLGAIIFIPQTLPSKYVKQGVSAMSNSRFDLKKIKVLHLTYWNMFTHWMGVLRGSLRYDIILILNLIGMFGSYPAIFYIDYYATTLFGRYAPGSGLTKWIIVMYNIMGTPGRIIPAFVADKIGRVNVLIMCIGSSGAFILALWLTSVELELMSLFVAFALCFGFAIGPFFSLFPACLSQLFGANESQYRIGLFLFSSTPGPILGSVIAGKFIKKGDAFDILMDSFVKLCLYCGIMMLGAAGLLLIVRLSLKRGIFVFI